MSATLTSSTTPGAFAYLSDEQKVYARFFWQQTGQDRYRLLLTNPLGSTELSLTAQPGGVQLIDNKGQTYNATDAEEMIGRLTGMPIPLNSLRQWIIGLPGDATDYSLDDQYRLRELNYTQNGKTWHVTYSGYTSDTKPTLPSNMELNNGSQRIKLKMDNWIVNDESLARPRKIESVFVYHRSTRRWLSHAADVVSVSRLWRHADH